MRYTFIFCYPLIHSLLNLVFEYFLKTDKNVLEQSSWQNSLAWRVIKRRLKTPEVL